MPLRNYSLTHSDSGTSEHKDETVCALGPQPVKIAELRRDVFGSPRREDELGSGVEDGLKSIQEVTGDTDH